MATCDLLGDNNHINGAIIVNNNNNQEIPPRIATMRKRMASEIADYHRFPRRSHAAVDNNNNNMACSFMAANNPNPLFNYSTINMDDNNNTIFPSSNFPAGPASFDIVPAISPQPPAVCGFSGLPLFPPTDRNRNVANDIHDVSISTSTFSSTSLNPNSNLIDDSSATVWIDGVIRDLINTTANVSIPQLIHNVREIIYPCNPNLAGLLEYRLRSLMEPLERRRKDVPPPHPPSQPSFPPSLHMSEVLLQRQQQCSTGVNYSFAESSAVNQYLNWGITTPVPSATATMQVQSVNHHHKAAEQPVVVEENTSSLVKTTTSTATTSTTPPQPPTSCNRKEEVRQQKRDEEGLHLDADIVAAKILARMEHPKKNKARSGTYLKG